jgi:hypothetical protein
VGTDETKKHASTARKLNFCDLNIRDTVASATASLWSAVRDRCPRIPSVDVIPRCHARVRKRQAAIGQKYCDSLCGNWTAGFLAPCLRATPGGALRGSG